MEGRDEVLLDPERSATRVDGITERIARLKREIAKGAQVYTTEEIGKLESMLEEYEKLLTILQHP